MNGIGQQSCSIGVTGFVGRVVLTEPLGWVTAPFSIELGEQADRLWPHKPGCFWTLENLPGSRVYGHGQMSDTLPLIWGFPHWPSSVPPLSAFLQVLETQRTH